MSSNPVEPIEAPDSNDSSARRRADGKAIMKDVLANLKSPWREVYQDIKSRDPKGHSALQHIVRRVVLNQ